MDAVTDINHPQLVLYIGPETPERAERLSKLQRSGLTVQIAATADAGVKRLHDDVVDCVLVDGQLPDADFVQVRTLTRETRPSVPVLLVGASNAVSSVDRGATTPIQYAPDERIAETVISVIQRGRIDTTLDHYRRLKETIQHVVRDVIDASTRETVYSIVYNHMSDLQQYQIVWVADYDDETDTVLLRAPITGEIDSEDLPSLVGNGDSSFISSPISNREVAVIDNNSTMQDITTNPESGDTNPDAEAAEEGTPVVTPVVVPFVHAESVHGFLLLVATQSKAVDEPEKELLADLGRFVGYVLDQSRPGGAPDSEAFASMVVHELTNPLNIAQGNLEMALSGDTDRLETVKNALNQIEHILTDELALLRGKEIGEVGEGDLAEAASNAWTSVITEEAELEVDEPIRLRADHGLLTRLLANLFDNAINYGGDEVTVTIGPLKSGFYVADNGPGIPEAERDRVFNQGYTTASGTGLGLTIVKHIVDAHGWDIMVTDSRDGGTRLEINGVEIIQ